MRPTEIPTQEQLTETEIRQLRDNIFGPSKDNNWEACREHWMRPADVAWLLKHQPKDKP